jgi:rare lipoprotein A
MGKTYYPLPSSEGYVEKGVASWYGRQFHGRKTSNGEVYDMYEATAAHKTLPMNTLVLVENLENGKEMAVRINDRGPFVKDRIIDLSLTAARKLDIVDNGTAKVKVTALGEARTYRQGDKEVARFLPHQDFQQGDFYVQIGSFTNKNNALRLQEKMKSQGNIAVITQFGRGNSLFYRVQVQAGSTLSVARNMEKDFNSNGYPDAFVVAR